MNNNLDSLLTSTISAALSLFILLIGIYTIDMADIGGYRLLSVISLASWIITFFLMFVNNYEGSLWLRILVTILSCLLALITFISRKLTYSPFFNIAALLLFINYCIYALEFMNIDIGDR